MIVPSIGNHIEIYQSKEKKVTIYNANTKKTFVIGEKESLVLAQLNGKQTLEDIHRQCPFYSLEELSQLVQLFSQIGLFAMKKKQFNLFKLKIRLFNPNRILEANSNVTKILTYWIFIGNLLLFLLGMGYAIVQNIRQTITMDSINNIINAYRYMPIGNIVMLFIGVWGSLLLHEVAHVITARHYDVNVPEIGFMLYCFMPCAYTNISGINLLDSKRKKLLILSSGTFVNLGIIGLCYFAFHIVQDINMLATLLGVIITNVGTIFMNGIIFLKFDGYYSIEILLDEPRLKENAVAYVKQYICLLFQNKEAFHNAQREISTSLENYLTHVVYFVYVLLVSTYVPLLVISIIVSLF